MIIYSSFHWNKLHIFVQKKNTKMTEYVYALNAYYNGQLIHNIICDQKLENRISESFD